MIEKFDEEFELPRELLYGDEPILDKSTQNQNVIRFLIEKYGPHITLQEVYERYEEEKGENLDYTHCDGYDEYDYAHRPIKIAAIKYELSASKDEVQRMIDEMKQTQAATLLFVPYYEKDDKSDLDYCEGIVNTRFLTRHILDSDYQYDSIKWGYEDGMFRFAIWKDDVMKFTAYLHHKLKQTK